MALLGVTTKIVFKHQICAFSGGYRHPRLRSTGLSCPEIGFSTSAENCIVLKLLLSDLLGQVNAKLKRQFVYFVAPLIVSICSDHPVLHLFLDPI